MAAASAEADAAAAEDSQDSCEECEAEPTAPEDDQPLPNLVPCNLDAEQFARYDTTADGILDASEMQVLSEDIKRGNFKLKKVAKQPSAYAYGDVKAELKAGNFKLKKASKISPPSHTPSPIADSPYVGPKAGGLPLVEATGASQVSLSLLAPSIIPVKVHEDGPLEADVEQADNFFDSASAPNSPRTTASTSTRVYESCVIQAATDTVWSALRREIDRERKWRRGRM